MNFGKAALRVTKNYTKGYSDTQAKVREATSNDPWGPSGTQMNEIAQLTYNQNDFIEIMEMLDKRLNDKGKNWRHVFKSLTVLDYLLHQGSENVVIYFRDNIYIIKTLKEFQFVDEEGKDQGANVRQKAKDITNLLQDEDRLREERRSRASMRDRMIRGVGGHYDGADDEPEDENAARRRGGQGRRGGGGRDETDELKKAIEESKKSLAQEVKKREEDELKEALKLSEQEELKRQKDVDNSNAQSLFDDQSSMPSPFPRADPTPYAVGLQPQMTSLQPQFTAMPMQPQFTSFNPYQQQAEQEAAQQEFLRQQQMFMLQQQQAQQQQQQQEEWMRQQMMQQQQQQQMQLQQQQQQQMMMTGLFPQTPQIQVQPTGFGSNNPFAPSPSPSSFSQQSNNNSANSRNTTPSFNLQGTYDNHNPSNLPSLSSSNTNTNNGRTPSPSSNANVSANPYTGKSINVKTRQNLGENERQLEHLFANRDDGQDTFGNVGAMRYGYTDAGRAMVAQQKTGNNPFAKQGQQQQNNDKPFFDI